MLPLIHMFLVLLVLLLGMSLRNAAPHDRRFTEDRLAIEVDCPRSSLDEVELEAGIAHGLDDMREVQVAARSVGQ